MFDRNDLKKYIDENSEFIYRFHRELCLIPAPSWHEEKRAEYIMGVLDSIGVKGMYTDSALNVVVPYNLTETGNTVFAAHTDTVFPFETPLDFREENGIIYCPGVSDDTSRLSELFLVLKYMNDRGIKPEGGLIIVFNAGEEGLGNLKGVRQLFRDYEGRISKFVTVDSSSKSVNDRCVGSHRYRVTVTTAGGHSFAAFGRKNAIAAAAEIIGDIYSLQVPKKEGTKTTYNVGTVSGGTSVNTIAQRVEFLCEYRSDDVECLSVMKNAFEGIFEARRSDEVGVEVELVGERPCAKGVCEEDQRALAQACAGAVADVTGVQPKFGSSSTDCNIPLSLGIPAVAMGGDISGGTHTTEEWLDKASMLTAVEVIAGAVENVLKL